MKLREYAEQVLSLYNYFNGAVMTDAEGVIEYYYNNRPDVNSLKEEEVLGKSILEVYPNLTEETSSIMQVLRTGLPIANQYQTMVSCKGQIINSINSTLPIKEDGKVIGSVEVSRYQGEEYGHRNIFITPMENEKKYKLYELEDIVTCDPGMLALKKKIAKISKTESTVLIYGATGTGKELAAQAIHMSGNRRSKRFVSKNCAAIPQTLLESVLFGTVKGSFTGAEDREGIFEYASGGTLFLDEINEMEQSVQAKVLRAIEERRVTRVGSVTPIDVDVRILAAMNQEPLDSVRQGRLREDLYYRLKVVSLSIPPLVERKGDVKVLTDHFIEALNRKMGNGIIGLSPEAEAFFERYDWPGNVRELKNALEGAFNLCRGTVIELPDLEEYFFCREEKPSESESYCIGEKSLKEMLRDYEREEIVQAIRDTNTLAEAAKLLQISRQNLHYKMKELQIATVL